MAGIMFGIGLLVGAWFGWMIAEAIVSARHKHKWVDVDRIGVYDFDEPDKRRYSKFILQCEGCGKMKVFKA
jgi:hypothetical protein